MKRLLLALAVLASACGDPSGVEVEPITGLPRPLTAAEEELISASNGFALGLLRETRLGEDSHNTFLSPLSASMALGMTMTGAAGETWTQMRDVLGFAGMEEAEVNQAYADLISLLLDLDPSVELALGNSLWSDDARVALLPDFVERVETSFGARVSTLDFSDPGAVDVMNDWAADVTRGRIRNLIDAIPPGAVAYLINAVYFLGDWRTQFDESRTRSGPFTLRDGSLVTVPFMSGKVGYRVLHPTAPGEPRGVELPYGGGAFTAVAMLPPEGRNADELLNGLDAATWDRWMAAFDAAAGTEDLSREGQAVEMPRFELEWKDDLVRALTGLGMVDLFTDGTADLSRMNGARDLFVSRVIHQTFVRVDERGTEAAAATAVEVGVTSAPQVMRFDRPFLFAIRERYSGTILFLGVIGDPRG